MSLPSPSNNKCSSWSFVVQYLQIMFCKEDITRDEIGTILAAHRKAGEADPKGTGKTEAGEPVAEAFKVSVLTEAECECSTPLTNNLRIRCQSKQCLSPHLRTPTKETFCRLTLLAVRCALCHCHTAVVAQPCRLLGFPLLRMVSQKRWSTCSL